MAEPTQYQFDLNEVIVALIKHQGLHEGVWTLNFEFGLGAGHIGPTPAEAKPSAFVQVIKLSLGKPPEKYPADMPFIVDAAKVNPRPATGVRKGKKG